MKKHTSINNLGARISARKGSILMEYLIIQVFVAGALMLAMSCEGSFNGVNCFGFYSHLKGDFVGLGLKVKEFHQRIIGGLSLPIP